MSNSLPSGWESTTVGELASVKRGASPRPIQDPNWWGGSVGWIRISDVTSSRKYLTKTTQYLSEAGVKKSVQIKKGEVVLSICATIGRPIIVKVDACIHDGFVWFDKLRSNIDREFWYYFLLSKEEFLSSQRQSGTQGNLNTGIVSDLTCFIPPLKEQQKIASILTAVDEVIASTTAQINKLKDLKIGMMQELLTKGIGHTEFKDSPAGRIPKAWECIQVSQADLNVIDGDRGSEYPKDSDYFQHEFCLFLSAKNVTKSGFQFDQCSFITREKDEKLRKGKLQRGDIVITTRGSVGNIAFYDKSVPYDHVRINSGMAIIRNTGHKISSDFLDQLLHSRMLGEQIETLAFGSAQPQLTISVIQGLWLPMPSLQEQHKIVEMMNGIIVREKSLYSKLKQTMNMKKALMQDLLTGSVRVSNDSQK